MDKDDTMLTFNTYIVRLFVNIRYTCKVLKEYHYTKTGHLLYTLLYLLLKKCNSKHTQIFNHLLQPNSKKVTLPSPLESKKF